MLKCFEDLIGRTVEAYMDDIVVKSKQADHLIADLEQTFTKLQANDIKLNPEKCVFGVPRGMLLGFIISERGIEANPKKISTITRMGVRKMDPRPIYFGFWCLMTNTTKLD